MVLCLWQSQLEDTHLDRGPLIFVFPSSPHLGFRDVIVSTSLLASTQGPRDLAPDHCSVLFPSALLPRACALTKSKLKTTIRMLLNTSRSSHILFLRPRWSCPIPLLSTATFYQGSSYPSLISQPAFYTCRFRKKLENSSVHHEVIILALPVVFFRDGLYFSHYSMSGL